MESGTSMAGGIEENFRHDNDRYYNVIKFEIKI